MREIVRIANTQGFWGDRQGAAARLIQQQPNINYLTMDYLAEVSLSLLAKQREHDSSLGYAVDFVQEMHALVPFWENGLKVVANAGGLNPRGCAEAVAALWQKHPGSRRKKIGIVSGDNVLPLVKQEGTFDNLDTGMPIDTIRASVISANAYLGAKPIADAFAQGADLVITGRVADPSLTVACCMDHYQWDWEDYDRIAAATIAGHLIECGMQVTGGIASDWLSVPDPARMGFPIIEMEEDGTFVITKPENTGGVVDIMTVKEQLLYELGDPGNYLSPDVGVSFLSLHLEEEGKNRVRVTGGKGRCPPATLKVSATYRNGYYAEGMLTLFGRHMREKAHRCGKMVIDRVKEGGYDLSRTQIECIGGGDVAMTHPVADWELKECVLRVCVADKRKEAVACFAREWAPLITSGPQGVTGYRAGRPKVQELIDFWPCIVPSHQVKPTIEVMP